MVSNASKRRGGEFNKGSGRTFNNFILQAKVDIPMQGGDFTWSNNRIGGSWARLDRFLMSPIMLSWFPNLMQTGYPRTISNHSAITLGASKLEWGPRPFRIDNAWLEDKELMAEVKKKWVERKNRGSSNCILQTKLWVAKSNIKRWAVSKVKDVATIKDIEDRVAKECLWRHPQIRSLPVKKLTKSESESLEEKFRKEEVWVALTSCDGNKALEPDGFNLNFVKENWSVICDDFMLFMEDFHGDGSIVKDLNKTFIALIPKCVKPITMKDFRPISLVGSLYKILAKVLANSRRKVINSVLGETQMAFVKSRHILDSFVIVEEIIHHWRKSKGRGILIKLDFEKAYDSLAHTFLDDMLSDMGFGWK
ncbi:hypothetical protein Dsin_029163 [Dipteronia sinensis]|uniref:Reverse transcriptase domain-containing protein n=1 Tax=Dipteronia sinensis TaxID=43782 RepID=A0AAD9ZS56_9ROSI|nr:hypothetical protein Dsin_029163 [Dipteronia sinensis]